MWPHELTGRKLASTRIFLKWNSPFLDSYTSWLLSTGHTLMVSVRAQRLDGSRVMWADIANAQPGTAVYNDVARWADAMKALGAPAFFTLNHEPEATVNLNNGTSADYVAAWMRVRSIFAERGASNVSFLWIMTAYSFDLPTTDRRYAPKWYPGDAYVDGVAADAYNWYNCRTGVSTPWKSLAQIIDGIRKFGLDHPTESLYLTEWASVEDPAQPGRKAQWINDAQALFKSPLYSQFQGVSYFNLPHPGSDLCDWRVTTSSSATTAFSQMANDIYYSG